MSLGSCVTIQRTTLNVSLTPELGRFVEERVSSGHYQTASEVIREALRLLIRAEEGGPLLSRTSPPSRSSAGRR